MSIETLLREEIQNELGELSRMKVGDEEYKATVDGITKMVDRVIEFKKIDNDLIDKSEARELEAEIKMKELNDEKRNRLIQNCLTCAGIAIPAALTVWGTIKSIEFEKEGTITTIMGRGFIQKLLPKK